jgi:hypothetical protein
MIYVATITTNAKTPIQTPKETTLTITKGLIFLIEVEFPAGCSGLVHIQIFDGSYQLFPATPGEYLRGDNVNSRYDDLYLKTNPPFSLKILTYNEDTVYNHTLQIRIGVASTEAFMSRYMPSVSWDKFNKILAEAATQQEEIKQQSIKTLQESLPPEENQIPGS